MVEFSATLTFLYILLWFKVKVRVFFSENLFLYNKNANFAPNTNFTLNKMKKLFILLLVAIMIAPALQAQVKRGDVNNDGFVNSADVVAVYNIIINGDTRKAVSLAKQYSLNLSNDMLKVADLKVLYIDANNQVIEENISRPTWQKTVKAASKPYSDQFPAADEELELGNTEIGLSLNYNGRSDYDKRQTYDIGIQATMNYVITYDDGTTMVLPAFDINPQTPDIEGEYVDNAMNAMCQTATTARDYNPENDYLEMSEFWQNNEQAYTPDPEMGGDKQIDPGTLIAPTFNENEWVDLGLPSGLKWATRNVGASTPYELGGLYGWGDATGYHTESNNRYYYTSRPGIDDISHTRMDIATQQWGQSWRIPTKAEAEELIDNCTFERETVNGCEGVWFKSKNNGEKMFMPCAGDRYIENIRSVTPNHAHGYYWTSNLYPTDNAAAYAFHWDGFTNMYKPAFKERYFGCSVRPVKIED